MFWFDIDHKTKLYFRDSGSDLAEVQSQGTHNPLTWARCGKMAPGGAHSYEGSGVWSAACICKPARCFPSMRAAHSQPSCTGRLLLQPAAQPSWLQDSSSELPCVIMPQERGREEVQSVICTQPGRVFAYAAICPGWGRKKRWTRFSWYHTCCILNPSPSAAPSLCSPAAQLPLGMHAEALSHIPPHGQSIAAAAQLAHLEEPEVFLLQVPLHVRQALRGLC